MKDGIYALHFSADGFTAEGTFCLQDNQGEGHDELFRVEGHLVENRDKLRGVFNIMMSPSTVHNSGLPEHYSLDMSGTSNEDDFVLIGAGPLGIIIDIRARWTAPLASSAS